MQKDVHQMIVQNLIYVTVEKKQKIDRGEYTKDKYENTKAEVADVLRREESVIC